METQALTIPRTVAALNEYAAAVAELYRRKLIEQDKFASGRLAASVTAHVTSLDDGRAYEVSLSLEDYWKYVEAGSQGVLTSPPGAKGKAHWPPPSALIQWIRVKPVIPRPDSRGRIPSEKSLAFLIGRKIYRHGIKPVPALAETLYELNAIWLPRIEEAFEEDVRAWADAAITLLPE